MQITRARVEHLLKVGIFQESKKGNRDIQWKHFYMCGSHVVASADTEEGLNEQLKGADIPLFPKTLYRPPMRSRDDYFEDNTLVSTSYGIAQQEDESDYGQYVTMSSATCIIPYSGFTPVETYDFSPFELTLVSERDCVQQMITLLMCVHRDRYYIPREVRIMIFNYLLQTSNRGYN